MPGDTLPSTRHLNMTKIASVPKLGPSCQLYEIHMALKARISHVDIV